MGLNYNILSRSSTLTLIYFFLRFDAGGWYRYDDTNVTETNEVNVRKGSNRANGYIFMYVHSPLWDQCNLKFNKNINNNNVDPLLCDSSV